MNRADRLDPSRRVTVRFALTVLQRRLASSPEAIHQSLVRRVKRLRRRRHDLLGGRTSPFPPIQHAVDLDDLDEFSAAELGRTPIEQAFNNRGFDILSEVDGDDPIRIEVKGRIAGADSFDITISEILLGQNAARTIGSRW